MEAIGTAMARVLVPATECSTLSVVLRPIAGEPQTITECEALEAWALALPATDRTPATEAQIRKHLTFIASTLPTQAHDDDAGERRTAVYVTLLAGWSNEAMVFMSREVLRTLRWFPVPAQMIEALERYRPPTSERDDTLRLCGRVRQEAFAQWEVNMRDGQPIGDVPERWVRIGEAAGYLRRLADGNYVSRAAYAGPRLPVPA